MRSRLFFLTIAFAVTLLLGVATACGGDDDDGGGEETTVPTDGNGGGGGELSLEEYFEEIDGIFERSDKEIDDLNTELQAATAAGTLQQQIQAIQDFLKASAVVLSDAIDDMEALDEPEEVRAPQDAFVSAIGDALELTEGFQDDLNSVETAEALDLLATQFDEDALAIQEEGFDAACFELQAIADDNSIDVDLNCED